MEKVTHRLLESVVSALYVDWLPCGTEEWGKMLFDLRDLYIILE